MTGHDIISVLTVLALFIMGVYFNAKFKQIEKTSK